MRRLFLLCFLLCAFRVWAAPGDFVSCTVRSDGWSVDLVFEGMDTNGTWNFGFATNNTPNSDTKMKLTVWSPGFDDTGTSNWTSRTVWGTKRVRFPYPGQAFADQSTGGGNLTNRVALSDWVYTEDAEITLDLLSGLYNTNSVTSAAVAGASVANQSQMSWGAQKVIGNWTWPGLNLVTNTMRLRAVGFHSSAQQFRPVRMVKFIVRDESGNAQTNTVTQMSVDTELNKTAPFWNVYSAHQNVNPAEYIADVTVTGFDALERLRCDFIMYPWHGIEASCLNTLLDTYTGITPLPTSITNLYDPDNAYSKVVCVVDASVGNDANGRARIDGDPTAIDSSLYFLTIAGALTRAAQSNNTYFSHNDVGGATIYLRSSVTNWTGGNITATTVPKLPVVFRPYPGDTVSITHQTGSSASPKLGRIVGLDFKWVGTVAPFYSWTFLHWDGGEWISSAATAPIQNCTNFWLTRVKVGNWTPGLKHTGTPFNLRGCDLNGHNQSGTFYTWIGNVHPNTNGGSFVIENDAVSQNTPKDNFQILYGNYFCGSKASSQQLSIGRRFSITNGLAIVNNVFEYATNNPIAMLAVIGSFDGFDVTNVIRWHNVFVGQRVLNGYNETGTTPMYRYLWSTRANNWSELTVKTDTYAPASGNRIGDWPVVWGVGNKNDIKSEISAFGANTFPAEFVGLYTYNETATGGNLPGWTRYMDDLSNFGTNHPTYGSAPPGGGNYAVKSDSPHVNLGIPGSDVLPFDIIGNARGELDPPGAYSSATPRKGAGFF